VSAVTTKTRWAGADSRKGAAVEFIPDHKMHRLLAHVLQHAPGCRISLNVPQVGGERLVHKVTYDGTLYISVSQRPFAVI